MDKLTLRSVTNVVRTSLRGRRETGSEAGKQRARYASAESEIRRLPRVYLVESSLEFLLLFL